MLSRVILRRNLPCLKPLSVPQARILQHQFCAHPLRRGVSTAIPPPSPVRAHDGKKFIFPERLIVYHSGATRSAVLGCLRVTTIFIFAFFSLVVVPTHWYAEDQPKWVAAGVMLSGMVPMMFVGYIASPFVAHIHLRLPAYARYSRDVLKRYTHTLPNDAKLEITTMSFIGLPRRTLVKVSELKPVKERFGMVNYAREVESGKVKRPWWAGRPVRQFGVHGGTKVKGTPDVWEDIQKTIVRRKK